MNVQQVKDLFSIKKSSKKKKLRNYKIKKKRKIILNLSWTILSWPKLTKLLYRPWARHEWFLMHGREWMIN